MVLDGAGDDLGRRGRAPVDEDDDGPCEVQAVALGAIVLEGIGGAALGRKDLLAGLEDESSDLDGRVHDPARVIPEVEEEAVAPSFCESLDGALHLRTCVAGEVRDADVRGLAAEHERVPDRVGGNLGTLDRQVERLGETRAVDRNGHLAAFGAAQPLGHVVEVEVLGRLPVHGLDDVAGAQPEPRRRGALDGRDHRDLAAAQRNDDADPVERALLALAHLVEGVGVEEVGVRVEERDHAVEAGVDQLVEPGLPRCVVGDETQDLGVALEEAVGGGMLAARALARHGAGEGAEADDGHCCQDPRAKAHHHPQSRDIITTLPAARELPFPAETPPGRATDYTRLVSLATRQVGWGTSAWGRSAYLNSS